jgi:dihydropteroate synthase
MKLRLRDSYLPLDSVALMGVLNVTPDSFSDGGLWLDEKSAVGHGIEMGDAGAAIIDVGGESTRPGADPVTESEELRRVIPIVEQLVAAGRIVSIDTRKPAVAKKAVAAGAQIVNDTLGEAGDESMDRVAAETGAALFVMHSRGTPQTMRGLTEYEDVVEDVAGWLEARLERAQEAGVPRDALVIDPGIGFAKNPEQNLELLARLDRFADIGFPVLVGTSRKSFMGAVMDLPVEERVEATAASVVWSVIKGAKLARVHDVREVARAVAMVEAIMGSA